MGQETLINETSIYVMWKNYCRESENVFYLET